MLSRELLRENPTRVGQGLAHRGADPELLARWLAVDEARRTTLVALEERKRQRNESSREIGELKRQGADAGAAIEAVGRLKREIEEGEAELGRLEQELAELELALPNLPHDSVPVGGDESANLVVRTVGRAAPRSTSSRRRTGTSARRWASSTSSAAPKLSGARFAVLLRRSARGSSAR